MHEFIKLGTDLLIRNMNFNNFKQAAEQTNAFKSGKENENRPSAMQGKSNKV
jgi:hypothetical protein